ncbi:hypothetical protein Q3G72_021447 [Acer saccharum]|nr:hypothetical protein Q3G72_021447 [Acer saccharum]
METRDTTQHDDVENGTANILDCVDFSSVDYISAKNIYKRKREEEEEETEEGQRQKGPFVAVEENPMSIISFSATRLDVVVVLVPSKSLLVVVKQLERAVLEGFVSWVLRLSSSVVSTILPPCRHRVVVASGRHQSLPTKVATSRFLRSFSPSTELLETHIQSDREIKEKSFILA